MGLLALLAEEPSHGYHLKAGFEARTGGVWTVNVGQVYTTLERLRADGLAEPVDDGETVDGRDRRPWRITEAGKGVVEDWFDDAAIDEVPPRDEFLVKVLLALGRSRHEALAVVDRQRTELYRVARAGRRARRTRAGDADPLVAVAQELMAEAVAARHEADLQWLDRCEELLTSRPDEGPSR